MQVPRRYGCGTTVAKVGIRAPSVYGGAGGYGTRISKPYSCMDCSYDMEYCGNEKRTMQNLNGRLATYLNKVHFLEKANQKLELQIQEFYDKRSPAQKNDHTGFYATITRLSDQIYAKSVENSALMLKVDTFRLTADDFKMRLKRETKMRMNLEEDVRHLKNFKDSHTLSRKDLEIRLEELRENRTRLEKNHKEKVLFIWTQLRAAVIPVIPASRLDFNTVLEEMRAHYEAIVSKNNTETSKWYESKVTVLQSQINTTELQTLKA
ncbi:hypothetical protein DPEC_G00175060 [Dallia pectoralis]|uniref:Uncharacterized protein n=1 Tax=Dallia pectoralis TaxID=75939 RepID=A0ACC2GE81_DALPE|nr:hypothetical protein DPEC_G00175060 [Dallia pectoralis]